MRTHTSVVTLLLVLACTTPGCVEVPPAQPEPTPDPTLRFSLPVEDPSMIDGLIGVDHDPEVHDDTVLGAADCLNFEGEGFPACYDEHDGSDFLLEGRFETMDAGSLAVLAAADGEVLEVVQDQYDRCHLEGGEVTCDGNPIVANRVRLEHDDGTITRYLHLMRDSVPVEPGQAVECGDVLGLIGSSGNSSFPHLHFEVETADGEVIDPFAGPLSQPESLWVAQADAYGLPALGCPEGL